VTNSIVIVDDDPIIRMDIREMLEEEGYEVSGEARNGEEAIELVARLKPDLVIMDVKMPVMNGIKAAQIIRKLHDSSILLLTAYSQRELVQDAREAGVAAYLVKPVSEEDLIPAVEIALSQKEKIESLKKDLEQL
jgi:response regulator NasT